MLQRSTIQLLRFPFSLFLLPVYLFGLAETPVIRWKEALLAFGILHLLVYPASNGYNSYMDRDETPIGGLARPLLPTRQLFWVTVAMDGLALLLSLAISPVFLLGLAAYIAASRAYSYRGIRLKRYPFWGFLTVFLFQGALVFFLAWHAAGGWVRGVPLWSLLVSSLLIGSLYPLTQIYQHEADLRDGVRTLSYVLGRRGTFVFSGILFATATFFLFLRLQEEGSMNRFYFFLGIMLPVVSFFLYWLVRAWHRPEEASFRNSLRMNGIATLCTAVFFITLIIWNH